VNSGDVDIYGVEVDAQLVLTERLSLNGALGVTKYDLKDEVANNGPNLFPAPSDLSYNAGAQYVVPFETGDLLFVLNYAYMSGRPTNPDTTIPEVGRNTDSAWNLPSYGVVNGRIRWSTADGRVALSLYGNNLLDKNYALEAFSVGGGYWDRGGPVPPETYDSAPLRRAVNVTRARPRNWGVTLQYNF